MTLRLPMMLRPRTEADIPFITSAWLRSYRMGSAVRDVPNDVYYHHEHALIQRLWRDPGVTWLVGAPPDAGSFAYGFLCGEATDAGPVLHYLYVKGDDRRFGAAGELLESFLEGQPRDRAFYTHRTTSWERMLDGSTRFRDSAWIYDPYLAGEDAPWRA